MVLVKVAPKQQFKMLDPKQTGNNVFDNIEISSGVVLKKYRNYLTTTQLNTTVNSVKYKRHTILSWILCLPKK